jgi:hypothetical protein
MVGPFYVVVTAKKKKMGDALQYPFLISPKIRAIYRHSPP